MGKTFRKERTKPKEHTKKPIKRCKKVDSNDLVNTISPDWDLEEDFNWDYEDDSCDEWFCEDDDIRSYTKSYTISDGGQLVPKETVQVVYDPYNIEPLFDNYKCFCEDADISHCGLCYTMTEDGQLVHKETGSCYES